MSDDVDELVDMGGYPEIYADGVGDCHIVGGVAKMMLFSWHRIDGVLRKCIVASIVRPVSSLGSEADLIERAKRDQARAAPTGLPTLHS